MISEFCEAVHPIAVEFRREPSRLRCRRLNTGGVILVTDGLCRDVACYVSIGEQQVESSKVARKPLWSKVRDKANQK